MIVRAFTLVVIGAFAAGCASAPVAAGPTFPPRPIEIREGAVTPCSMLTPGQERLLGVEKSRDETATVNDLPSPGCIWLTDSDLGYAVQVVPLSATAALTEPQAAVIVVDGFGAVRSTPREMTGGTPACQVTVDVAEGRLIRIQAQGTGARPRSDDEMCAIATDVAGKVMSTVVAAAR